LWGLANCPVKLARTGCFRLFLLVELLPKLLLLRASGGGNVFRNYLAIFGLVASTGAAHAAEARLRMIEVAPLVSALPTGPSDTLFLDAPYVQTTKEQAMSTRGVARSRTVAVSADTVAALRASPDLALDSAGQIAGQPEQFVLRLFDDTVVRLVKVDLAADPQGNNVLRALVVGEPGGDATLVIAGDEVSGKLRVGARRYSIQPAGGTLHTIIEYDPKSMPRLHDDAVHVPPLALEKAEPKAAPDIERPKAISDIRVLVVYTPKAKVKRPNITRDIAAVFSEFNTVLSNSYVDSSVNIVLAGTDMVDFTETSTTTTGTMIDTVREQPGDFARIATLRAELGADLVQVWIAPDDDASCGVAFTNRDTNTYGYTFAPDANAASYGVSAVFIDSAASCVLGQETVPHEIGHNMGLDHDRFVLTEDPPAAGTYGYGYVDIVGRRRDVMAYTNACDEQQLDCVEQPYFSNPNVLINGRPLGIAYNQTNAADAARYLTEAAPFVARLHTALTNPIATVRLGPVYSTASATKQSFLRVANNGSSAGTATFTFRNSATGDVVGTWTTSSLPAGSQVQYYILDLEKNASIPAASRPTYYTVEIKSGLTGYIQHVLYRPDKGTLTNLSTCDAGVTSYPRELSAVHSNLISQYGLPSTVVINNTGATAATASLGIYDARNGTKLGTYTALVQANGEARPTTADLEAVLPSVPKDDQFWFVVKLEGSFTGFLQHLMTNVQAGVVTDMSTACALNTAAPSQVPTTLRQSIMYSTASLQQQSFVRFFNNGHNAGVVRATFYDYVTGLQRGQWTSPSIVVGQDLQYFIGEIEKEANITGTKPAAYTMSLTSDITGYFQHVLYRPDDGTLTNLSTCGAGVTADPRKLGEVHSSNLNVYGLPSSVVVRNTDTNANAGIDLGIYDARDGKKITTYRTVAIPANGAIVIPVSDMETAKGYTPPEGLIHYVIKAESSFIGFIQHLLDNQQAGVTTDMTTMCALRPAS